MKSRLSPFGLVLVFLAAQAGAQHTGTLLGPEPARIPDDYTMSDADRAWAATNAYAECLLKRNPRGVERAVALRPGTPTGEALSRLASDECLDSGQLRIPRPLLRGSAYVALYRRDYGRREPTLVQTPPDYAAGVPTDDDIRALVALRLFASCVVRHDTDHSRQFVLAPVDSKDDRAALAALSPSFGACLEAGSSVHFSKPVMQGTLAEVLYRESIPSVSVVAAGKK